MVMNSIARAREDRQTPVCPVLPAGRSAVWEALGGLCVNELL